jgi:hypothetical protein
MSESKLKTALAITFVLALASTSAFAQKTETVFAGVTSVKLSGDFVGALQSLGVKPGTIAPTKLQNGKVNFPVVGGAIDLKTLAGEIIHSGGLTLTAGATQVRLQAFTIDTTGAAPVLTGLVVKNGALLGRVPLFDLDLSASSIQLDDGVLRIKGVRLTLDKVAAGALNGFFSVSAFNAGFPIGTAKVLAILDHCNGRCDANDDNN